MVEHVAVGNAPNRAGRRRRLLALLAVPAAILVSACAVGVPKPVTDWSPTALTLNADVFSTVAGNTDYWFRFGTTTTYGSNTPIRSIAIDDDDAHPVSEPVTG